MSRTPLHRMIIGCLAASLFSLSYIIAPVYLASSLIYLALSPSKWSALYCLPLVLSIFLPIYRIPGLLKSYPYKCMLEYFSFEEWKEINDEDIIKLASDLGKDKRSIILAAQPHGVMSFGGICASVNADPRFDSLVTAAAGAVLVTPIIKNIIGQFNLIDASGESLKKRLSRGGIDGVLALYVGGIAELFKCSADTETLYLKERKGFIKLALREGAEVIPLYFFGNTNHLSIPQFSILETISRKLQVSLTIFWGLWGLPIPRPTKTVYIRGKPLGIPKIENPSEEDVNKWHAIYISEVTRLFETYKVKIPEYKHKKLVIM